MPTVIQERLNTLASAMLLAFDAGNTEELTKLKAQAEEISTLEKVFNNTFPSPKVSRTKAVTERKGRTTYDESEVIKSAKEIAIAMPYAKYDKQNPQPKQRVEFLIIGQIKDRRNGSSAMLTALKSCETVADLEAGKVYAFKSLRDVEYLAD